MSDIQITAVIVIIVALAFAYCWSISK